MLERQGKVGAKLPDEQLKQTFHRQINQVKRILALKKIPVQFVEYERCIEDPAVVARELREFFLTDLNVEGMISVVDPSLWRQRTSKEGETGEELKG
ncbi:MAG: hypothetical protein D6710_10350 [Nitrospirae bacterium]|nr:MAG: hypothetical protein D6710_10350 [Nitrospirota bacterium]